MSNPSSVSVERSGLSDALPVPPIAIPGTSAPLTVTVEALKNVMASRKFGWRPDRPFDARKRNELTASVLGKNDSSLTTHEAPNDGYGIDPKFGPNALFLSLRTEPF